MKPFILVAVAVGGCAVTDPAAQYRADVKHCFFDRSPDGCNALARTFGAGLHGVREDFELGQALASHACKLWPAAPLSAAPLPQDDTALIPVEATAMVRHPECSR